MSVVPWPYWLLALAAFCIALVGFGWLKGASQVQAQWDAATAAQQQAQAQVQTRQAEATVQVVTQYVDRIQIVREKGDTLIQEIPVYVPVQADAACTVHRGFVSLHDAAAAGELPEPARDADAATAGITLSAVAGTVAANYQTCHENAEQLKALPQGAPGHCRQSAAEHHHPQGSFAIAHSQPAPGWSSVRASCHPNTTP